MIPSHNGKSGIQVCNLTENNGKFCTSEEEFYEACRASAILGTMQAGYTNFNYLTDTTKNIVEREALLGCSITGIMDNPDILLNSKIQKKGAEEIKKKNKKISQLIGINQSARTTCVKPAGSTSCILGTASGIHPHHAKRYIRRVQANRNEFPAQYYKENNPLAVETSVWSANGTDDVVSFLCEVPRGAILKNAISAVEFLEQIKSTQRSWVEFGTNENLCVKPYVRHNVSCTVVVQPEEWADVEKFIFENQEYFSGISLLPSSGDLDYPQAPFSTVLTPEEIVENYGNASVFASGLTVDGLAAFDNNLWKACDAFMEIGEAVADNMPEPQFPHRNGYTLKEHNEKIISYYNKKSDYDNWFAKKDWLRRAKQFSERYFNGDDRRTAHCLKHVSLWKSWCDIQREHTEVDWSTVIEKDQSYVDASTLGAQACAGGACQI
jgi:ribonucleoside-diphosphate reductase alpha chain